MSDHIMAIVGHDDDSKQKLQNLDIGRIKTSQSPYIKHFKAIEGKLNPRTNKPFKFDSISLEKGWQDDPVWQSWNWTNVKEISFQRVAVNPKHSKLPLTRLNSLKTIDFNELYTNGGYDTALQVLKQNPDVEVVKVVKGSLSFPSQLARTVCSLKKLKDLTVLNLKNFVDDVMTCLPAENVLEKLEITYFPTSPGERIVATPAIIAKLRLNQLTCLGCDSSWSNFPTIQILSWVFDKDHNETVHVLKNLVSMNSVQYLRLEQHYAEFSPQEFKLLRKIAPRVNKMEIHYPPELIKNGKSLLKELPDFHAGEFDGQYLK